MYSAARTQLYFERLRVLEALRASPGVAASAESSAEVSRLRLRAAELAAGLDAWTGGAYSRARNPSPPGPEPE